MAGRKLIWRLYSSYLAIIFLSLAATAWYCSHYFRRFHIEQTAAWLLAEARFVGQQAFPFIDTTDRDQLAVLCRNLADSGQARITLILPSGEVLADSHEEPAMMNDHSNRPELIEAVRGRKGRSIRFSDTLGKNMMYVAAPIIRNGYVVAVVRTSIPINTIDQAMRWLWIKVAAGGFIIALCAAILSLFISRSITRPVTAMKQAARLFSTGTLDQRLDTNAPAELGELAASMNEMARQLDARIRTITGQRNELEAVLSSMVEGVMAVNVEGRILSINRAASDLLEIDRQDACNRSIEEIVRNIDVHQFVKTTIAGDAPTEADIFLPLNGGRFFALHGAAIFDADGNRSGAVIVLNDMTRLRRLENIRRDFVANVSHELRTPITSIKGFVETLLDGAIDKPDQAERFLQIIARHTDRLNAIIEDLLSLSRLEEGQDRKIAFENTMLKNVMASVSEMALPRAQDKNITVTFDCPGNIQACINAPLLEQAVLNLVENAIKYSEPGDKVIVSVRQEQGKTAISVADNGCGIDKKHLERIFERFYVVDKGRSRKLGGTGLGLAIVKHIAQVHGGRVTAESTPGKGSVFTIVLS